MDTLQQLTIQLWKDEKGSLVASERHQIAINLEEIDTFRPVRPGNSKDIEKFTDLLDIAIVNLKESNRSEELKDGMLYINYIKSYQL